MLDVRYSPKLLLGLEDLWRNEIFVDTTLEFGDEEVKVHRAVLAAASDYFKSMFAGALKESWSHEKIRINEGMRILNTFFLKHKIMRYKSSLMNLTQSRWKVFQYSY